MVTRSALIAENECVHLIFFFLSPVKRLVQAVPLLAALLLHCTPCKVAEMGWEGALCAHSTPLTHSNWKAPVAPKTLLFLRQANWKAPFPSH